MRIQDYSTGDDGYLNGWGLRINAVDIIESPLPTQMSYLFNKTSNLAIDSSTPKESILTVSGIGNNEDNVTISNIKVYINIEHEWVTDLLVYIKHVDSGIIVDLYDGTCNSVCDLDNIDAWFDEQNWISDVCGQCNENLCAVCNGPYRSIDRLTDFNGLNPNSQWALGASDSFPALDNGFLIEWKIEITI